MRISDWSSDVCSSDLIRGSRWDYDNWAAMGCAGWSYNDVLPYFRRSEGNVRGGDDYHGGEGPLTVSDQKWANTSSRDFVASAAALQSPAHSAFNCARQAGFGLYQFTQCRGAQLLIASCRDRVSQTL